MKNTKTIETHHERTLTELNIIDCCLMHAAASEPDGGKEFCRLLLFALLGKEFRPLTVHVSDYFPCFDADAQGIRMALRASRDTGFILSIDYPCITDSPNNNVARRGRFYQAVTDHSHLCEDTSEPLEDLYVIFLLPFDPLGKDYMLYHIQNNRKEIPELDYPDGLHYLYFNTQGTKGGSTELRQLLDFIQNSTKEKARNTVLQTLYHHVEKLRRRADLYIEYEYFKTDIAIAREEYRKSLRCLE